jgi:hypothetical protein
MGLAWFLVYSKWRTLRTGDEKYNQPVRFWAKIFGLNFAVGVVTGIPMEFQFGTNWAGFSRYADGVIGQTLAMEAGDSQSILLARIASCHLLNCYADFGPLDSARNAGVRWVEFSSPGLVSYWRRGHLSGDALFDARGSELTDRLRGRIQQRYSAPCLHLVAGGLRSWNRLFRLHLATRCGKSECEARHSRVLLANDFFS